MTTIQVKLAESPTDVLAWLVAHPEGETRQLIAEALAERATSRWEAERAVARALRLLHELGFVATRGNEHKLLWYATDDGVKAVRRV